MWWFLRKLKIELLCVPAIPLLGIYPEKIIIQKDMHPNVHWSIMHSNQHMGTTLLPLISSVSHCLLAPFYQHKYVWESHPLPKVHLKSELFCLLSLLTARLLWAPAIGIASMSSSFICTSTSRSSPVPAPPPPPPPTCENTHFWVPKDSLVTKSNSAFLSLNYLPFSLFGAFNFPIPSFSGDSSLSLWGIFFFSSITSVS